MAQTPADPKLPILQRDHRSVMGKVLYTSRKPERMNQERGREFFRIDVHADGTRTCTAHCEIDDRPSVMRDITYSLDKDWNPTDCFVRISVGSRFMGSGWFRFRDRPRRGWNNGSLAAKPEATNLEIALRPQQRMRHLVLGLKPQSYSMLRNNAPGPEIGLLGRILAGLLPGKH